MQRLNSVNPQVAQGRSKELLDTVQQAFGVVPNTAKVMANSPAVLESFLAFSTAMSGAKDRHEAAQPSEAHDQRN